MVSTAARTGLALVAGACAWIELACVERGPYACTDASECVRDGQAGICAAPGFCAYADDDCPSGHRFSDLAGDGLADRCTQDATESTGDPSTSDGGVSVCGDGIVASDETCDDENLVDGDGCNADCEPSGAVAWSVLVPVGDAMPEIAWDVTALASGDPIVVGGVYGGMGSDVPQTAWAGRLAIDDGALAWQWTSTGTWEQAYANAVALDADNRIAIGGWALADGNDGWVITLSPDGVPEWTAMVEGDHVAALVGNVEGFVAVGAAFDGQYEGIVTALDADGGARWSWRSGLAGEDVYIDVGSNGFDRVSIVGEADGDIALQRAQPDGVVTFATYAGAFGDHDGPQGMATHPSGDLVIAGFETTAFGHDPWLARVAVTGEEVWSARPSIAASAVDEEFEDVAVDVAGNVYAVGFVTNDDKDAMVRKYAADGTELWARTYASEVAGDDTARGVAVAQGGVVVVGERPSEDGTSDLWIARLGP